MESEPEAKTERIYWIEWIFLMNRCMVVALTTAWSLLLAAQPVLAQEKKQPGWNIRMRDSRHGRSLLRLCSDRASIESGYLSYVIQADDYKSLYVISHESKTYMRRSLSTWISTNFGSKMRYGPVSKVGKTLVATTPCFHYVCKAQIFPMWVKPTKWEDCTVEFRTTSEFRVKSQLADALCILSEIPSGHGVPMTAKTSWRLGNTHAQAVTDVEKTMHDPKTFKVPCNYKKVENELEVVMGGLNKQNVDELLMSK